MIQIKNKVDCCGCKACEDVCPKRAITFKNDIEGFWYPEIDMSLCIDCKLCEKVCPIINNKDLKRNEFSEPECHAAIHKNIEIRFDSTSGGLFSALAENTYKKGGYVGGAVFTDTWGVRQFISSDSADLKALRSSKYLQSDAQGFYKAVYDLVKMGLPVLICGTPCQMAALRRFIGKDYDNLTIVDFICRGVNSPKVFRKYIDYLEERFEAQVVYFKAKNKELGWRNLTSKVVFKNGKVLYDTRDTSYFTIGYLQTGVYCRPSCYECKFKGFPRIADITIADFWGAEKIVGRELDNDMGTSVVMLNNKKGKAYFEEISHSIIEKEVPLNVVIDGNQALIQSLDPPSVNRNAFYHDLDTLPFREVAAKYVKREIDKKTEWSTKQKIRKIIDFLRLVRRTVGFDFTAWKQNIKYNFLCKQVNADIFNDKYMLIHKHCVIEIHPQAEICLEGRFVVGYKKFSDSKIETRLLVENDGKLIIGKGGWKLCYGSDIEVFNGATLDIGGNGATNIGATIICGDKIEIGERVMLGRNVTIRDNNGSHFIARRGYKDTRPVYIGQHSWLCEGCCIIAGGRVGEGSIVSAHSLVASHIPSFTLASGIPAQVVDDEIYWKY